MELGEFQESKESWTTGMTQEDRNHFLPCLQASSLCLSLLYGPLITDGHHLFFMSAPQRSSLFVYFYYSLSSTQLRYCQVKKKSIFYVKNKPILGGIIHLQIVTLRPGRTVNPRCVPVTDLGFGFLIWLRDVQKPQVVNSSLLAMHLRGSRTLFIPASVWNTLYSINWKKTVKVPTHMIWVKHQIFILHNAWTPGQKMRLGGGGMILWMFYLKLSIKTSHCELYSMLLFCHSMLYHYFIYELQREHTVILLFRIFMFIKRTLTRIRHRFYL